MGNQGRHCSPGDMADLCGECSFCGNEPTIVTGDMNSHASNFNRAPGGGFESNLVDNGFVWAWEARGNPGYPRIDSILYSRAHWTHSDCGDTGTGSSDHTS